MTAATPPLDQPYVIARVDTTLVGIPSAWAVEMVPCDDVTPVPMAPAYMRGIAIRRSRTVRVVDARLRMGSPRRTEETDATVALLEAREADHVRWLDTLTESIRSHTPFVLARDPSQCAFGKWYDHYVPPTMTLRYQLAKFDQPHRRIHALASEAETLVAQGGQEAAMALIEEHRTTTLEHMRHLFRDTRAMVQQDVREIVVVHDDSRQLFGLIVDDIVSVERLRPDTLLLLEGRIPGGHDPLVRWTARTESDAVVLLPTMAALMGDVMPSNIPAAA